MIKIHRKCEYCNIRLILAEDLEDRIHCICKRCGSVVVFFKKDERLVPKRSEEFMQTFCATCPDGGGCWDCHYKL